MRTTLWPADTTRTEDAPTARATSAQRHSHSRAGHRPHCAEWICRPGRQGTLQKSYKYSTSCRKVPAHTRSTRTYSFFFSVSLQSRILGSWLCMRCKLRQRRTVWVPHVRGEPTGWWLLRVLVGEAEDGVEEAALTAWQRQTF